MSVALAALRLRANPAYQAVPWNRLAREVRETLTRGSEGYGILVPREGSELPSVAIDRDTALLFLTLQEPGPAPDFVFSGSECDGDLALRRLLLDHVLELQLGDRYVGGTEAYALLGGGRESARGALMQLSLEAIRYGAALVDLDAAALARKLYSYNTRPMTRALRRRLPDRAAYDDFIRYGRDSKALRAAALYWTTHHDNPGWLVFASRRSSRREWGQPCKLYVGLALEELPECLPSLVAELGRSGAMQFKIGTDLAGLLRPDKLVAYFPSKEALLAAVQGLLPAVSGRIVHAVPFTAEIATGGALSWGIDPQAASFGERISWRQWICEKLAMALMTARQSPCRDVEPWQFALERLRLEGVDPGTFMPTGNWSEGA